MTDWLVIQTISVYTDMYHYPNFRFILDNPIIDILSYKDKNLSILVEPHGLSLTEAVYHINGPVFSNLKAKYEYLIYFISDEGLTPKTFFDKATFLGREGDKNLFIMWKKSKE